MPTIKEKLEEEFRKEYQDSDNESIVNNPKEISEWWFNKIDSLHSSLIAEIKEWTEKNNQSWDEDHPWIFAKDLIDAIRLMQSEYEEKIGKLEEELEELKNCIFH